MSIVVPISVVIAAHNEETVLERCLDALLEGSRPGELEIVVACNGCTDRTPEIARGYGSRVRVVETSEASKTGALNLGETCVTGFPRFYVDADVTLPLASVRRIAERLEHGDVQAAAPTMHLDLRWSSRAVRAYYRVWTQLPYVRDGMIGVGVYAVSRDGRGRFDAFPDVIADDGFVRALFSVGERLRVDDALVCVRAPARFSDLVGIKTRSILGREQLRQRFPDLVSRERREKSYLRALGGIVVRPWLWPAGAVYATVQIMTRRRARAQFASLDTYVWERDESSRRLNRP